MSEQSEKLKLLCNFAVEGFLDEIFSYFDLELSKGNKLYYGGCGVHGSDGRATFNFYPHGDFSVGNWRCRSRGCHEIFGSNFIGLIRGLLSRKRYGWTNKGDKQASLDEARVFLEEITGKNTNSITIDWAEIEKKKFAATSSILAPIKHGSTTITKEQVKKSLKTPSDYFQQRGYNKGILEDYCIGDCIMQGKEMSGRAVVPIFDQSGKFLVSCLGRSIYEKCKKCSTYHNPKEGCPQESYKWMHSKWRNSKTLKVEETLFNYWRALPHIKEKGSVILVESCGNALRLVEAGIHNVVALLGCSISPIQQLLLDSSGALSVSILLDNDETGRVKAPVIKEQLERLYNVKIYFPSANSDVGEMTVSKIKEEFKQLY